MVHVRYGRELPVAADGNGQEWKTGFSRDGG